MFLNTKLFILYIHQYDFRYNNMLTTRQIFVKRAKDAFSGFMIIDDGKIRSFIYNMYYNIQRNINTYDI